MRKAAANVVTGASGYTGRYITRRLLSMGETVRTLTGRPDRPNPFGDEVSVAPYAFDDPVQLARSLEGAEVLYNTYWVRFPRGGLTFDKAVENSRALITAAEDAGVRRIVHVSITNASADSPLPYFRGKGLVEDAVEGSTMAYAIVRPTVVFGKEDILINNIAWFLRRFPLFTIFGSGGSQVQPVFVEDVAEIAVAAGHRTDNMVIDAVGPDVFTFEEMVRLIAEKVGSRARLVHVPSGLALALARLAGYVVRDVVVTRDEIAGLTAGLLTSETGPTGRTRLADWVSENSRSLGTSYASELDRHYR